MHAVKPPVLRPGGWERGIADSAGDSMEIPTDTTQNT